MTVLAIAPASVVTLEVSAYLGQVLRMVAQQARMAVRYLDEQEKDPPAYKDLAKAELTLDELESLCAQLERYGPTEVTARPAVLQYLLADAAGDSADLSRAPHIGSSLYPAGGFADTIAACGEALQRLAKTTAYDVDVDRTTVTVNLTPGLTAKVRTYLTEQRDDCDRQYIDHAEAWERMLEQLDGAKAASVTGPAAVLDNALAWQASTETGNVDPFSADFDYAEAEAWLTDAQAALALVREIETTTDNGGA